MICKAARTLCGLCSVLPLLLASCSDSSGPDSSSRERTPVVQLSEHAATILVGDTFQAALVSLPLLPPGYVPTVEWHSSNPVIASVTSTGTRSATVTGVQAGQAMIHVAGDGARDSLHVTVIAGQP